MSYILTDLSELLAPVFDDIIDVRSPGEFSEDHVPGAINLPVLDDQERALVGTIYKQESAFRARKIGAALVAKRAGANIETYLLDKPGSYRPLVYCWRGGMRSGAFATVLKHIGWRAEVLDGGYKSFRRAIVNLLYTPPGSHPFHPRKLIVLDGNTGTGKTELLHKMATRGAQVLDLEGLAGHRGSLFGALERCQPAQKAFDTAIAMKLLKFDPMRPVIVEAESSRIGRLSLPSLLWSLMRRAPRLRIKAELAQRSAYLADHYADLAADRLRLMQTLERLRPYHPADRIAAWRGLADAGQVRQLARELVADHYDPKYQRQRLRDASVELGEVVLRGFDPGALGEAADELVRIVDANDQLLR